jgi:hypothetical protein
MYLHTVEPRGSGTLGGAAIILYDGRNLIRLQGSWSFIGLLSDRGMNVVSNKFNGRRSNRKPLLFMKTAMRSPAAVPELKEYRCPSVMHRMDDLFPGFGLLIRIDSRTVRPTDPLLRNHRGLRDDHAGRSSLGIVFGHQ